MRICVFLGSSTGTSPLYAEAARRFGQLLARRGIGLVYGGGSVGLMGLLADGASAAGGEVIGVIPEALRAREHDHQGLTALHVVSTMHERKAMMAELSDGFVALPGGIGTFEELFEVWTWSQLGYHAKPCALLNVNGFYDAMRRLHRPCRGGGLSVGGPSRDADGAQRSRCAARRAYHLPAAPDRAMGWAGRRMRHRVLSALAGAALLASALPAYAGEAETAALFDRLVAQPPRLRVFLQAMPKGGDLHNHLWGQPYAEQFIAWAGAQDLCVSRARLALVDGPCKAPETEPARDLGRRDQKLYSDLVESLSTRGRNQGLGGNDTTGHDDFFDTFGRFFPAAPASPGPMLASARTSAAANAVSYLELIQNPVAVDKAGSLALSKTWKSSDFEQDLAKIAPALPALTDAAIAETDAMERDAQDRLHCPASAACAVMVRYQAFVLRSQPPAYVFGQMALAFALADKDPRYVSVNIVAPEDGAVAVADFDLHMAMYRFFAGAPSQGAAVAPCGRARPRPRAAGCAEPPYPPVDRSGGREPHRAWRRYSL